MNLLEKIKDEFTSSGSSSGQHQDWYITIVRGEGIKDEHFYARSDPYLKVEFGGKHFKTRTIKHERSPDWNETFHFQVKPAQAQDIVLTLMDDDIGWDDRMGRATVSKGDLPDISNQEKRFEVPIYRNGQVSGLIHLRVKLIDNNMQQQQQSSQSSYQSTNIPYQQQSGNLPYQQQQQQPSSQSSSGYQQQQPMSYDGLYTQPQPQPQQQGQSQPYQDPNLQQYPSGQFQQGSSQQGQQSNFQQRSNDNYYGQQ